MILTKQMLRWLTGVMAALLITAATPALAQAELPLKEGGDPVTEVTTEDAEVNAAIAEAQKTLPQFLTYVARPPAGTQYLAFKYPLNGWEHIWVAEVRRDGDYLLGTLSNNPHSEGYSLGDPVRVPISEVSDWRYYGSEGVMMGHYTTQIVLPRLSPEEAAGIRESFGRNE